LAIIDVKKVTVIGHKDDKDNIVKALQGLAAVEVFENTFEQVDTLETNEIAVDIESKLSDIRFSVDLLKPFDESKKPFLSARPEVSSQGVEDFLQLDRKESLAIDSLKEYAEELTWAKSNINHAKNVIMLVKPYVSFDDTFDALGSNIKTYSTVGLIPLEAREPFTQLMDEYADSAYYEILDALKETFVAFIVVHLDMLDDFKTKVKALGFNEAKYENFEDSPSAVVKKENDAIADFKQKIEEINEQIAEFAPHISDLQSLEDYYQTKLQREKASLDFGYTKNTFVLEGWANVKEVSEISLAVEQVSDGAMVDYRDPIDGENYPTIVENNKLSRPFEAITEMYDTPAAKGIDPNAFMAPFYFIFFGMMMSDAGYGLLLAIACSIVLWKTKPTGMMGKILGLVALCGVSTLGWGIVFGGWFGINVTPLWFNPLQEPMMMLGLCLGIGLFQIVVGLFIAASMNFKRGKPFSALFDQFSWVFLLLGLPALLMGGVIAQVGKYMAITGAALLILFAGRAKKGIVGKLMGGLSSIYGITGYLSDVLSYSRIFGMGLATGVIAMVFNTIGGMLMGKWYGIPFGVAILLVGHLFNIGINTLGAYVHSCRLQYIEYYGKFFEGGGKAFRPLRMNLKHYRFNKSSK
jgi:V/A-type H+/Na+-transporting ATPase subunit I